MTTLIGRSANEISKYFPKFSQYISALNKYFREVYSTLEANNRWKE